MTSIPGIEVFEVSDTNQAKALLKYTTTHIGPVYIRCGVEPTEDIYEEEIDIKSGGSRTVVNGSDGAILSSGVVVQYAKKAAEEIRTKTGQAIRVVDMYSIKPIDRDAVISAAKTGNVIVAQDHNVIGGLGSIIATVIAEERISTHIKILGIPDEFVPMAHASYLYNKFELDSEGLEKEMRNLLEEDY